MRVALPCVAASVISLTLSLGCGGTGAARPTSPSTDEEELPGVSPEFVTPPCEYAFKRLKQSVPAPAWETEALVEADRATNLLDAGDPGTAAERFVGCAVVLRQAPADDRTSAENAEVCYYNAAYAFATAGAWGSEGRAALETAAAEDPARATYIRDEILADPPRDCDPPTSTPTPSE